MIRRHFIQMAGAGLVALFALPQMLWARPKEAFAKTNSKDVLAQLFPGAKLNNSKNVKMKVPEIAENGAVVPITISTDLPDVTNISLLVDENPNPLTASFDLTPTSIPEVSLRIKMGKTSTVTALVLAGGQLYSAQQEVKVTIGGCGG